MTVPRAIIAHLHATSEEQCLIQTDANQKAWSDKDFVV